MFKNLLTITFILFFLIQSFASDNFYKTTRFFSSSGQYLGSKRSYSYGRSYYFDRQGRYLGDSFENKNSKTTK